MLTCGYPLSSIAATPVAAAPLAVKLYWPENLDDNGVQIPNTRQITELFNYFEREAGLKLTIVALPWKRAQLEVRQGSGIIYGFSKSSERLAQYRFSQPVTTLHIWAISYGTPQANFAEVSDLKGKIIASGLGLSHGLEYEKARETIFTVQEDYASDRDRFKRLVAKRSDVILIPFTQHIHRERVDDFINHTMIPGFKDPEFNDRHFDISINPIFYDTIHFASGKGHFDEVMDKIDKAIQQGVKNGSLPKLFR